MPKNTYQNIDNDIQDMLEYYNSESETDQLEMEMYENGVSWSDFI